MENKVIAFRSLPIPFTCPPFVLSVKLVCQTSLSAFFCSILFSSFTQSHIALPVKTSIWSNVALKGDFRSSFCVHTQGFVGYKHHISAQAVYSPDFEDFNNCWMSPHWSALETTEEHVKTGASHRSAFLFLVVPCPESSVQSLCRMYVHVHWCFGRR